MTTTSTKSGEVEKLAAARDKAQRIVIDSSLAAGYSDSTWLDSSFKHELTDRLTAAFAAVPLAPGQQELREALEGMVAAFDGRPVGEPRDVTVTTLECAMNGAKRVLGWNNPNRIPLPEQQWQDRWIEQSTTPLLKKIVEIADLGSAREFGDADERLRAIRGLIIGESV